MKVPSTPNVSHLVRQGLSGCSLLADLYLESYAEPHLPSPLLSPDQPFPWRRGAGGASAQLGTFGAPPAGSMVHQEPGFGSSLTVPADEANKPGAGEHGLTVRASERLLRKGWLHVVPHGVNSMNSCTGLAGACKVCSLDCVKVLELHRTRLSGSLHLHAPWPMHA